MGRAYVVCVSSTDWVGVLGEVWAVNGGEALANGEEVRIAGVGTFGTRSRPARTGRTARTGEAVSISESPPPSLKVGRALRDAVSAGRRS